MEPLLIHLICSGGRNSSGDPALSSLSYLFSVFSDTSERSSVLAPAVQLACFQSFAEGWLYFLVWVVKLSSRSSFSLNCSEMHHVHTLTSKTMRNSLNNLFIFNVPKSENYNLFS